MSTLALYAGHDFVIMYFVVVVVVVVEVVVVVVVVVVVDGFDKTLTEYLKNYLNHRKLKININKTFNNCTSILRGVPQGSILGLLLCDLFLFKENIDLVSYVDDNSPFAKDGSSELEVINEIKGVGESLTLWFRNNCIKVNPDKFHLLLSGKKIHQVDICNEKLSSTCSEKFLGIKNDNKLTFEEHVEELCKKASQKVSGKIFIFNEI